MMFLISMAKVKEKRQYRKKANCHDYGWPLWRQAWLWAGDQVQVIAADVMHHRRPPPPTFTNRDINKQIKKLKSVVNRDYFLLPRCQQTLRLQSPPCCLLSCLPPREHSFTAGFFQVSCFVQINSEMDLVVCSLCLMTGQQRPSTPTLIWGKVCSEYS